VIIGFVNGVSGRKRRRILATGFSSSKKPQEVKKVTFAHRIVQDSPAKKFRPHLNHQHIKLGDFDVNIEIGQSSPSIQNSNSNSHAATLIPLKWIFGRIDGQLLPEGQPKEPTSPHSNRPLLRHSPNQAYNVERTLVWCSDPFCTRCLRMGHTAKDCTN
jgi:hypothetical protein